jgi:3-oxoadipate enol-lactonase
MTPVLEFVPGAPRLALDVDGDGPPVLFLHGIGGNRTNWKRQLSALAPHFRASAWDLRGYGDSDDYAGPMRFEDIRRDIHRVLDHLSVEAAHLVGLSLGGRIALDFTAHHPDKVLSLTLADTSAGSEAMNSEEKIEAFLDQRLAPLRQGLTPADTAAKLRDRLAGPEASDEAREEIRASLAAQRKENYAKTLEGAARHQIFEPDKVSVPCLVLNGEHDVMAPPAVGEALAGKIMGARFAQVSGAGHLSNIEKPEAFNALLLSFLREVS